MSLPLPNPVSPRPGAFFWRWLGTRRRLRELRVGRPPSNVQMSRAEPRLKVSVMLITYNHERYVAHALDSILMQRRDFDIEINVIDDASTDDTQAIVRRYEQAHPEIINCYFNATNAGHIATQLNTIRGFQTLRGEYFALLEGDDYWTNDRKLATQVQFLDAHPSFVACAHQTLKVFDDPTRPPEHFLPFKAFGRNRATIYDLISMAGVFHLSSIVYRNVFGLYPPPCLADPYSCEVTINMSYGMFGDFHCLEQYMSAYRVHDQGVFSGKSLEAHWLFHLHGFRRFAFYLGPRYWIMFAKAVAGFTSYVLTSPKRGEVTGLEPATRAVFLIHRGVALVFLVGVVLVKKLDRIFRRAPILFVRRRSGDMYRLVAQRLPRPLLRLIISVEEKFTSLRTIRRTLKAFSNPEDRARSAKE